MVIELDFAGNLISQRLRLHAVAEFKAMLQLLKFNPNTTAITPLQKLNDRGKRRLRFRQKAKCWK